MRRSSAIAASLVALCAAGPSPGHQRPPPESGEVALSLWPYCDVFVVSSQRRYSVVRWEDGLWVFVTGDEVFGAVDTVGPQRLLVSGRVTIGELRAVVEAAGLDLDDARSELVSRCAPVAGS